MVYEAVGAFLFPASPCTAPGDTALWKGSVKLVDAEWQLAHDCPPGLDKFVSKNMAFPKVTFVPMAATKFLSIFPNPGLVTALSGAGAEDSFLQAFKSKRPEKKKIKIVIT